MHPRYQFLLAVCALLCACAQVPFAADESPAGDTPTVARDFDFPL